MQIIINYLEEIIIDFFLVLCFSSFIIGRRSVCLNFFFPRSAEGRIYNFSKLLIVLIVFFPIAKLGLNKLGKSSTQVNSPPLRRNAQYPNE